MTNNFKSEESGQDIPDLSTNATVQFEEYQPFWEFWLPGKKKYVYLY